MDDLVEQGVAAFKAGKRDEARQIFSTLVKQNPNHERAWVGLYNVSRNDNERAYCLKQLLRINPGNRKARKLYNELAASRSKKTRPRTISFTTVFFTGIALFCLLSVFLSVLYVNANNIKSTPTATAVLPVEKIIKLTSLAADTQTAIAYSPTSSPTLSVTPTFSESFPTPTLYVYLTNTPFSLPTQMQLDLQVTALPQTAICSCSSDSLNCGDFSSASGAQACYDYCFSLGKGDIHRLDRDNDGFACEQ